MAEMQENHEAQEDSRHRRRVNAIAGVFLICLIGLAFWTVKAFVDHEKLQRCLDSRRPGCFEIQNSPPASFRLPAH